MMHGPTHITFVPNTFNIATKSNEAEVNAIHDTISTKLFLTYLYCNITLNIPASGKIFRFFFLFNVVN